jgi:hypothetical protein
MITPLAFVILACSSPLHAQSPEEVSSFLARVQQSHPSFEERVLAIAGASAGTPYHDGPLGEGPGAPYDDDPLIDLSRADCVTFVEQVIAMAQSHSYDETVQRLQRIRYKNGEIRFERRNHFMLADWVHNNPFAREVTGVLGVETAAITRSVGRKKFFGFHDAAEFVETAVDETRTVKVIPPAAVTAAEPEIPSPSLICFVGKVDWLFALHCGLYLRDESGQGRLYHASSLAGEVVAMDLTEYMASQEGRYLGITVHRIDEPHR